MTDEEYDEIREVDEQLGSLLRARRYDDACEMVRQRRDESLANGHREQASWFSGTLATCFTIASRDIEALEAAREGERIDPNSPEAKLVTARILLDYIGSPSEALAKLEEVMQVVPATGHVRDKAHGLLERARDQAAAARPADDQ